MECKRCSRRIKKKKFSFHLSCHKNIDMRAIVCEFCDKVFKQFTVWSQQMVSYFNFKPPGVRHEASPELAPKVQVMRSKTIRLPEAASADGGPHPEPEHAADARAAPTGRPVQVHRVWQVVRQRPDHLPAHAEAPGDAGGPVQVRGVQAGEIGHFLCVIVVSSKFERFFSIFTGMRDAATSRSAHAKASGGVPARCCFFDGVTCFDHVHRILTVVMNLYFSRVTF